MKYFVFKNESVSADDEESEDDHDEDLRRQELEYFLSQFVLIKTPYGYIVARITPSGQMVRLRRNGQQVSRNLERILSILNIKTFLARIIGIHFLNSRLVIFWNRALTMRAILRSITLGSVVMVRLEVILVMFLRSICILA